MKKSQRDRDRKRAKRERHRVIAAERHCRAAETAPASKPIVRQQYPGLALGLAMVAAMSQPAWLPSHPEDTP